MLGRGDGALAADPFERLPLGLLPAAVRRPTSAIRSIIAGWATAFLPSIPIALAAAWLLPDLERPEFPGGGPMLLFLLVVFSPFIETLIMAGVLELLRRFLPPAAAVVASAVGWGLAHSAAAPAWGLVIWWPFLVFSTLYLSWRERGAARAIGIVFATHALHNLPVAAAMLNR